MKFPLLSSGSSGVLIQQVPRRHAPKDSNLYGQRSGTASSVIQVTWPIEGTTFSLQIPASDHCIGKLSQFVLGIIWLHVHTLFGENLEFLNGSSRVCVSGVPKGGLGCSTPAPPRNSEGPPKLCQTQPDLRKLLKFAEFRTPTPQDVRKKGSKIQQLPRFAIVLH